MAIYEKQKKKKGGGISTPGLRSQHSSELITPCPVETLDSGKKKELKPKLFGPDIFRWGSLPREGVGANSSVCPSKPRKTKLFGGISRDFWRDIPEVPEKFEVSVQFSALSEYGAHPVYLLPTCRLTHRLLKVA